MYGQTEASPRMSILKWKFIERKIGSIGKPLPGGKFLIYDNKYMPELILKYNKYIYIVNSILITLDQNNKTNSKSYSYLFNYLLNITKIDDIKIEELYNNYELSAKNDSYKGYAITNLFQYNLDN